MSPFRGWRGSVESVVVVIAVIDDDAHGGVLVGRAVERRMVLRHARLAWHAGRGSMMMFLANKAMSRILSSVADRVQGDGKVGEF